MPSRLPPPQPFTPCSIAMAWSSPWVAATVEPKARPCPTACIPTISGAPIKGEFQLSDKRYCYPLTVSDYSSRFLLLCEALESNREELAFPAFERLFQERGLP